MKSELIVDVQPDEIAIALTEDDRLQEINREKRNEDNFSVGNIYWGRVRKVMPALNAVFVDVGHEKDAFLHYLDLGSNFRTLQTYVTKAVSDRRRVPEMGKTQRQPEVGKEGQIADVLKVGDQLLVQVIKEPINTKGPRLTAEISIAGRNMVLMPFADKVMVSSKIKKESERSRLKQLVQSIKPQGYGVIVRTVAQDKRVAELDTELSVLVKRWEEAIRTLQKPKEATIDTKTASKDKDVRLISEELGRTIGVIRDVLSTDFSSIQINDEQIFEEVRQYVELIAPEAVKIVKLYKDKQPIFDKFDITRQMKTGLGRTVGFKQGGYLVIDRTEALFSIDVNSGSKKIYDDQEENAFHYNMLAADEIAHQLRLRDIGGIIIIDFIDMDNKEHQQQLFEHMNKLMSRDRARHNVLPLSKFGLMQITRQRVRPAVEVDVMEVCPMCMGKGKVQPTILFTEQVETQIIEMRERFGSHLILHLHPFVYAYACRGWFKSLKWQWRLKYGISLVENQSLGLLETKFVDRKGNILSLSAPKDVESEKKVAETKVVEQPKKEAKSQPAEQPKKEAKPQPAEQPKKEAKPKAKQTKATEVAPKQEKQTQPEKPKKKEKKEKTEVAEVAIAEQPADEAPKAPKKRRPRAKKKTNEEKTPTNEIVIEPTNSKE